MTSNGSSSFFNKAATDPSSLGEKYIGPNYVYSKWIKSPSEMGMSGGASLDDFANNISGLMNYMQILTEGGGPALKTGGQNLGDRYFLNTGGQCKDSQGNTVTRSLYIDNVPDGEIPFISSGMDMKFTEFEGLIPGILSDTANIGVCVVIVDDITFCFAMLLLSVIGVDSVCIILS